MDGILECLIVFVIEIDAHEMQIGRIERVRPACVALLREVVVAGDEAGRAAAREMLVMRIQLEICGAIAMTNRVEIAHEERARGGEIGRFVGDERR